MQPTDPVEQPTAELAVDSSRQNFFSKIPPLPFALLTLCLIFFLYQVVGGVITFFVMGAEVTGANVALARWLTLGGQLLFILVPTLILIRVRPGVRIPMVQGMDFRLLGIVLLCVFSLQQILQGYMILQESIPLPESLEQLIGPFKEMIEETYRVLVTSSSFAEFLFVVIVVAIVPAIVEELLFRGLIQETLGTVFGGMRAAVVAGLVFAAYHLVPFTFIPLAVLGIFFGYLVHRSGNLSLAIVAHFFNNFLACVGLYLQMNEDFVLIAPTGEVSPVLLTTNTFLFLGVFVFAVLLFHRMTQRPSTAIPGGSV